MKKLTFPQIMIGTAVCAALLTALFSLLYAWTSADWLLSAAITFGTVCYHFSMRLIVGALIPARFDYCSRWFQLTKTETKLYKTLRLKRWKDKVPTYNPRLFSLQENTPEQILCHMCQAEVVHEVIVVLSFLPLTFCYFFGSFGVFFVTSLVSAGLDSIFIMLQRYNRPRVARLLEKQQLRTIVMKKA